MQVVIPAAGRGSRLQPATDDRPKALVRIDGEPLLSYVFDAAAPVADQYVVVIGYLGGAIRERFGDAYDGTPIRYVEQPSRAGLADALARAEPVVEGDFFQLNGDNVLRGNVADVADVHRRHGADATLLVERVSRERATRGGVISGGDVTAAGDGPLRVTEKPADPPSRLAVTGCFAFSQRIFESIDAIDRSDRGEYELPDAVERLASAGGRVETVRLNGWRVNVNTEADVARAERRLSGP
ncbi:nucleotidyltransferase family protein [Natronomonas sp.]|uniref:nucleotidyltransferase family protein n=1 Tax=Natronomonas sp. TaxID=2184060 RepID=UPI00261CDD0B|nr:nucleotidyltransferase family protein [Natronomonas sp.]